MQPTSRALPHKRHDGLDEQAKWQLISEFVAA